MIKRTSHIKNNLLTKNLFLQTDKDVRVKEIVKNELSKAFNGDNFHYMLLECEFDNIFYYFKLTGSENIKTEKKELTTNQLEELIKKLTEFKKQDKPCIFVIVAKKDAIISKYISVFKKLDLPLVVIFGDCEIFNTIECDSHDELLNVLNHVKNINK